MSKDLLDRLVLDDHLTRTDLRTLLLAVRREHEQGMDLPLSARYVAQGIGKSKRTAETALAHLQALGYLLPTGTDPKTRATTYRITMTEAEPDTEGHPDTEAEPDMIPKQNRTSSPKQARTNNRPYRETTKKTADAKAPKPPVWTWWIDACRKAGRRDPISDGADLGAAKRLADGIRRGDYQTGELRDAMRAYLDDQDAWLVKQGHPLRLLTGRLNRYLHEIDATAGMEFSAATEAAILEMEAEIAGGAADA